MIKYRVEDGKNIVNSPIFITADLSVYNCNIRATEGMEKFLNTQKERAEGLCAFLRVRLEH